MDIIKKINELKELKKNFCVATIVKTSGSTPGKVGFKYITTEDGISYGTIGGGEIEVRVFKECKKRINDKKSDFKEYILTDKPIEQVGDSEVIPMMCSGKVWIFYEVFCSEHTVYIFGGGHVGKELTYFLKPLNFNTILIDNRKEIANYEYNNFADEVILSEYEIFTKEYNFKENSFYVILTHGHSFDYVVAKNIIFRELKSKYIGVIASQIKASRLKEMLKEELGNKPEIDKINSPIGLNIGGETASEIALSIAAQMQSFIFNNFD
ncbi:MAG TPA: XdhC/CoxI family protein [Melioribacteraceae bacterium]|nr:XdhC/CoxI family protein [Melioribacteraceae bacterium]